MRKKTLPGTTSISQGLAQTLGDVGLEAALDAFEIAFPAVNLTVEVVDLSFTHFLPDEEAPPDLLITAMTDRGLLWLDENTDTMSDVPEGGLPAGNAWVATAQEFKRLFNKAKADGLLVDLETDFGEEEEAE